MHFLYLVLEENTDRPTTGRSSREARENEVIDDEPDVSTASTGGFGKGILCTEFSLIN